MLDKLQMLPDWFIQAKWRKYVSIHYAIISTDNGLLPIRCQGILWTSDAVIENWNPGIQIKWNSDHCTTIFIHKNKYENVVC